MPVHPPSRHPGWSTSHGQFREQQGLALAIFGAFDQANDPPSLMGAAVEDPFDEHFTAKQVSVSYQRVVIRCSFFGGADRTFFLSICLMMIISVDA